MTPDNSAEARAREVLAAAMAKQAESSPTANEWAFILRHVPTLSENGAILAAIRAMLTFSAEQNTGGMPGRERPKHGVAWSDDRLGQAYQLIDEAYQDWPSESGPGEALRAAREAVEAADMEIPE